MRRRRIAPIWFIPISALILLALSGSLLPRIIPSATATIHPLHTLTVQLPIMPNDDFVLKLPDKSAVNLTVTNCEGVESGGFFELEATNTRDTSDPHHVEVQVHGGDNGEGKYGSMYVSVIMGNTDTPVYSGNTPKANVTMDQSGSGTFDNVGIVNNSNIPPYEHGRAYNFSGEWSCKR
jgi:hypothetical protein